MVSLVQIPNLPAIVATNGAELFETVQAGVSYKISLTQISAWVQQTPLAALNFITPLSRTGNDVSLTTVPVSLGGTGVTTFGVNGVLIGNGASALSATAAGANGEVLLGQTGAPPVWASLSAIGVTSFSAGTTGFTPSTAATGAITLSGTLNVANGGTGVTTSTGTGSVVLSNSPTLVTPNLGTPSAVTLTNGTGLPISTGVSGLGAGIATFLGTPSSANLAAAVTDETGSGSLVFATSPILVTPNLGTPSAVTLTNGTGLPIATGVSGLGTGVATALAVNTETAGAFVVNGGALGTPASGNLANCTGYPASAVAIGIGSTTISGGTATRVLYNNGGLVGEYAISGTGSVAMTNSPTLVTPDLGTPSAVTLTNGTGLPIATGVSGLGAGIATFLGTPSSANLAAAVTDETGSGSLVFATSPTLVTPNLGTPSAVTLTNGTGLPIATGVSGLGAGVATFLGTPSSANLAAAVTDETGTGALVFAGSPALTGTPTAPTASAGTNTTQVATTAFANTATAANNPGMIYGLTLSTAGSSTTMSFAAGRASDSTGAVIMVGTSMSKTTSAWAAGNANGMLDTGAIAANTQYHHFLIGKTDGTTDYLCSLSPTAPTLPATYTYFRRIGSIKTNGSSQWETFTQVADRFYVTPSTPVSTGGTSGMTLTTIGALPTGIVARPFGFASAVCAPSAGGTAIRIAPANNSASYQQVAWADGSAAVYMSAAYDGPHSNTSGQIYVAVPLNTNFVQLVVSGWIDTRGQEYLP